VVVVGLGPAGADLVLPTARAEIDRIPVRFARTARHPAVTDLAAVGVTFTPFDAVYDAAAAIADVYPEIVATLVDAARAHGEVCYAVPGSPVVAERTVELLADATAAGTIACTVVPGLSFADLAWARVGVDPMGGARVLDGHRLDPVALEVGGPVLIAQVDDALVASDVKLALLDRLDPDAPVTVLARLGRPDEAVTTVPLADLDRVAPPDHLTAVFVELPAGVADRFGELVALARRLRGPGGCPWDAEQTHRSLTRYLIEEAYEVADAIAALPEGPTADAVADPTAAAAVDRTAGADAEAALADELGDLLFQVVFHGVLAEESGAFTTADVARGIHDKLVRRHPHVFGDVEADTADAVVRNWEQIKKGERGATSLVDGIPSGLPALLQAHKLFRKAASVGLDPGDGWDAARRLAVAAAAAALGDAAPGGPEAVVGDALAAAVGLARAGGVDAESALRAWLARYRDQFRRMEALADARGIDLASAPDADVAALWAAAAPAVGAPGG
jgi:tetrapyrrole methylase family protein/MazG family protein